MTELLEDDSSASEDTAKRLTPKMREFARLYMSETALDPAASARAAGYKVKRAGTWGRQMLQNPIMQEYLRELIEKSDFTFEMGPKIVFLDNLARATFDPMSIREEGADGILVEIPFDQWPRRARVCVKEVIEYRTKHPETGEMVQAFRYIWYDALKASELVGKWAGMDRETSEFHDLEPQPEWAGLQVEGLPAERGIEGDDTTEQRAERARQLRAVSLVQKGDWIIDGGGNFPPRSGEDDDRQDNVD